MNKTTTDYRRTLIRLSKVLDKKLFFIVGLTRPGTAWLQHAINAHPDASCKGEGHFTNALFPLLGKAFANYNQHMQSDQQRMDTAGIGVANQGHSAAYSNDEVRFLMASAAALTMDRWSGEEDVSCIGEKTPEHALNLDGLTEVFPDAHIIHVIRDGRDEAVSVYDYNMRVNAEGFTKRFPDFPAFAEFFAGNWIKAVGSARYFGRNYGEKYMEIRCEDLHTEAAPDMERLCRFLSIDDSPETVSHLVESGRKIAFPDGVINQWQDRFDEETTVVFNRQAGELLKLLDYFT
ncbi:MAG: sulfotransferase [Rhodospirillales bacterium]|nr:sulfotransferase [Rhodospirillales bacterium]